jgi:hypothetical protein
MAKDSTKRKEISKFESKGFAHKQDFKIVPKVEKGNLSIFDIEKDFKNTEKKESSARRCGSVDKFDNYLKAYENAKSSFTVVSYGSTKKIIYGKHTFLFSGLKGQKKPKGMHLIGMVKRDVDKLIKQDKIPQIPAKKPYLTFIHHRHLEFYGEGEEALAIDINHCYWRTAFLLGFIEGSLIAIGTLGKVLTIRKYKDGIKNQEFVDDKEYKKYGGFFWEVILKINELMLELWQVLKEDFLMFLTDCVVVDPKKKDVATAIMEKHGYSTKSYKLIFTDIEHNKVAWITDKGEKKQIVHNRMLDKSKNKE